VKGGEKEKVGVEFAKESSNLTKKNNPQKKDLCGKGEIKMLGKN